MAARDDDAKAIDRYRRSLLPAGGVVSDEDLRAMTWIGAKERTRWWARRTRELLAESPRRDLASAAIQARDEAREARRG